MAVKYQVIPIMVTGGFGPGKTEFIRAISDIGTVPTQRSDQDISLDVGRMSFPNEAIQLYFFGWPGEGTGPDESFLPDGPRQRMGTVVVVDSVVTANPFSATGATHDQEAIDLIAWVQAQGKPFLVVANKQDKDGARSVEEMRAVLQLDDDIPLLPCSARTNPGSVRHALIELLKLVPQDEVVRQAIVNLQKLQRENG